MIRYIVAVALVVPHIYSTESSIPEQLMHDLHAHRGHVMDVAIIGGGPAGMAAAFGIAHRQRVAVLFSGDQPGGQAIGSHLIDNLPGTMPISGQRFCEQLQQRLQEVGVRSVDFDPIVHIEVRSVQNIAYFIVTTQANEQWLTFGIILATGGEDKRLNIPGEAEYWDKSVFTCVSCASLRARRSKNLFVVGGGDASVDMLLDLLDLVPQCTLLVRSPKLRATPSMQQRIMNDPRVTICYQKKIKQMIGDGNQLQQLVLVDHEGVETIVAADCVFLAIGKNPATAWLTPLRSVGFEVETDSAGYIKVDHTGKTNMTNVYAVGDVIFPDHTDHQIDLGMALARVRTARSLLADLSKQGIFEPLFQQKLQQYYVQKSISS